MKIRSGFVSNSSSSSFIVFTGNMKPKEIEKLEEFLEEIEEELGDEAEGWGESGRTWEQKGNFFIIETYYLNSDVTDEIIRLVPEGSYIESDF